MRHWRHDHAPHRLVTRLRPLLIHAGLFAAACATTTWAQGPAFAATLMGILVCHELGHYVVARRHGVDVSLPYFIPLPPQISLGTMGAVIRMRGTMDDRNRLLDVGAAGPIAGLVVALPLLVLGLTWSQLGPIPADAGLEGNSILYLLLKWAVFGRYLPSGGVDVQLHPVAFAAWWGVLITMINLIPIGQLDGGHVMRAWLGDRHERVSAVLHRALPLVGAAVAAVLTLQARAAGLGWWDAISYAGTAALPWLVWTALLVAMRGMGGGVYHPPTSDAPLTPGRRWLAWLVLALWILIFTPVPMRRAL
jgi:membrane-associated protease RseP (regulator of RpoE activity)